MLHRVKRRPKTVQKSANIEKLEEFVKTSFNLYYFSGQQLNRSTLFEEQNICLRLLIV